MENNMVFDVVIIGGSYAGLSAAMALGRSLRNVLIIDAGNPCNKQTPYSHNFITQDGEKPLDIALKARTQVLEYKTVQFLQSTVIHIEKQDNLFEIINKDNSVFKAKYIILASGVSDIMPNIQGFAESWGISILHCPYCHGYEIKGKKTGILANSDMAVHYAKLLINLTKDLVIFTNGKADFTTEQLEKFTKHNIPIVQKEIAEIQQYKGVINSIIFKDNNNFNIDVMYASVPIEQKSKFAQQLGCEMTEKGLIKVDTMQKTSIDKVFACGDNSTLMRSIASAVYTGGITGAFLNNQFLDSQF